MKGVIALQQKLDRERKVNPEPTNPDDYLNDARAVEELNFFNAEQSNQKPTVTSCLSQSSSHQLDKMRLVSNNSLAPLPRQKNETSQEEGVPEAQQDMYVESSEVPSPVNKVNLSDDSEREDDCDSPVRKPDTIGMKRTAETAP